MVAADQRVGRTATSQSSSRAILNVDTQFAETGAWVPPEGSGSDGGVAPLPSDVEAGHWKGTSMARSSPAHKREQCILARTK